VSVRATVDRDLCIGAGNCVRLARGYFALDEEDIAVVVEGADAPAQELQDAERSCPAGAIVLRDETGGTHER
jgi:ferredoxin